MNLVKLRASVTSAVNRTGTSRSPINLSILDSLLPKCRNFEQFNQILAQLFSTGLMKDTYVASIILRFSTDSAFVHFNDSLKIFNQIENSNGFIWNTMTKAYVQRNEPQKSIFHYRMMIRKHICVDNYTYPIVLQASAMRTNEVEGRELHSHVMKRGFKTDVYVVNTLIHMYAVCGNMSEARKVFNESPVLDLVSWNSILAGYVQQGNVEEAKFVFEKMPVKNVTGSNSMIVLLGKCGRISEACRLFKELDKKDLFSWTAMLSCYEQNGMFREALWLFVEMHAISTVVDEIAAVSVLSACAELSDSKTGKSLHGLITRIGCGTHLSLQNALIHMYISCDDSMAARQLFDASCNLDQISWNSMLSGYVRCGSLEEARKHFDSMPSKDVVSWSVIISGYSKHEKFSETMVLFQEMLHHSIKPDETTLVSMISACTRFAALDQGRWLHSYVRENGLKVDTFLGTALIDMYMKCGCLETALEVFYDMKDKSISLWNALILGFAMNGEVESSMARFQDMIKYGVMPNEITFVAILGACRHMGLVNEGRHYFDSMMHVYGIKPNEKHYGCMVDLLGRAGLLAEAERLLDTMPMAPGVATWGALLGACKKYGDIKRGERLGRKLIELQPNHTGFHVLLSNLYASRGSWDDVLQVRGMMVQQGIIKAPGCSMVKPSSWSQVASSHERN